MSLASFVENLSQIITRLQKTALKFSDFFNFLCSLEVKSIQNTLDPNFSAQFVFLLQRNVPGFICRKFQPNHNTFTEISFEIFRFFQFSVFFRSKKAPEAPSSLIFQSNLYFSTYVMYMASFVENFSHATTSLQKTALKFSDFLIFCVL